MPGSWLFTIRMMLLNLTLFFAFRLIMFFTHLELLTDSTFADILRAFLIGLRFDLVICCYYLLLPFLLLVIQDFYKPKQWLQKAAMFTAQILFILGFLVSAADLPWYNQFSSRFNITAFQWMDHPGFVVRMIFGEPRYWLAIIPFFLAVWIFLRISNRIVSGISYQTTFQLTKRIIFAVLGCFLILIGIRGRLEPKSPIRIGTAYFSDNAFLNQLGLNPNYTLVRTYLDSRDPRNKKVYFVDDENIFPEVARDLGIETMNPEYPLLRKVEAERDSNRSNIVLVIMESMNAGKLSHFGNTDSLTPNLDSLLDEGMSFSNIYTSGTHTYNGIFSTLYAYPALFSQHPMKTNSELKYHGLPTELKKNGYHTIFFTTHDGQFDNAEGFLKSNGMDQVVSIDDYPDQMDMSALGVPDDFMFKFGIPQLNELSKKNKPFLAVFLTASDHGPYIVPPYFHPKSDDLKTQIIEYADWSIGELMKEASARPWFENTIFVFIADHGSWFKSMYTMPLSYHHSPLLFYQPSRIKAELRSDMGGQIDVFPTLMGMLNLPYINNSLGLDLLKQKRPYIYFSNDFQYGVVSDSLYLIMDRKGSRMMHHYRQLQTDNIVDQYLQESARMKRYAELHMQASQMLKDRNLTFVK